MANSAHCASPTINHGVRATAIRTPGRNRFITAQHIVISSFTQIILIFLDNYELPTVTFNHARQEGCRRIDLLSKNIREKGEEKARRERGISAVESTLCRKRRKSADVLFSYKGTLKSSLLLDPEANVLCSVDTLTALCGKN